MNLLTRRIVPTLLSLTAIAWMPFGAVAHGDEDHGEKSPTAAAGGDTRPRFEAHSDLFEVVGTVDRDQLTITVDRYASNEPVQDAKVEIEIGSAKGIASPGPDGSYSFKSAALVQAGTLPVALTITAGKDADLLAAELTVGAIDTRAAADHAAERPLWWWAAGAAGAVLVVIAIAAWRMRSRRRSTVA